MEKDNFNKRYITDLLRLHKHLKINEIVMYTKLSRPTVYLHLESLEKEGFIKRSKDKEKKGAPVTISLVENSVAQKDKKDLIKYLKIIQEHQPTLTQLKKMDLNFSPSVYGEATFAGLIDKKVFLTPEGKKFLEENK